MNNFTICQLTEDDVEAYRAIRLEMLQDTPEAFGDSYEQSKEEGLDFYRYRITNGVIFAAFHEGQIIGTTGYFIEAGIRSDHKARIWGVYVKPEFRGQDISFQLLNKTLEALPDKVCVAQLAVVKGNLAAEKTYKKAGFELWGIEEKALKVDDKYYDEIHMVKFLK